jgi:hypothetical protein
MRPIFAFSSSSTTRGSLFRTRLTRLTPQSKIGKTQRNTQNDRIWTPLTRPFVATGFCRSSFRRLAAVIIIAGVHDDSRGTVRRAPKDCSNATRHKTISNSPKNGLKDPTAALYFFTLVEMDHSNRAEGALPVSAGPEEVSVECYVTRGPKKE